MFTDRYIYFRSVLKLFSVSYIYIYSVRLLNIKKKFNVAYKCLKHFFIIVLQIFIKELITVFRF